MSEGGFYGQFMTVGLAFGWDTEEGFTVSVFQSISVGASADVWTSANFSFDNPYGAVLDN